MQIAPIQYQQQPIYAPQTINWQTNSKKPFYKKVWFWLVVTSPVSLFILLFIIVVATSGGSTNQSVSTYSPTLIPSQNMQESPPLAITQDNATASQIPMQTPSNTISLESANSIETLLEIPEEGICIFDNDGIVVTLTRVNRDRNSYVSDIDFLIANNNSVENSIENLNSSFITSAVRINNLSVSASFSATIAAGKLARANMRLDSDDVTLFGIKNVYEIAIPFVIYGDEGFYGKSIEYEPTNVHLFDHNYDEFTGGDLVFSNKDVDIYSCGFVSGWRSWDVVFVVKNKTNENTHFILDSMSVNGIMNSNDRGNHGDLLKGTYRIFRITLDDDISGENVNEIEFTIKSAEFSDIVTFNKTTIGIVNVEY